MLRSAILAAALAVASVAPAMAQGYNYYPRPPGTWAHQDFWRHMNHREREAYFHRWRHERWRCDHGDRYACHWLHRHRG